MFFSKDRKRIDTFFLKINAYSIFFLEQPDSIKNIQCVNTLLFLLCLFLTVAGKRTTKLLSLFTGAVVFVIIIILLSRTVNISMRV